MKRLLVITVLGALAAGCATEAQFRSHFTVKCLQDGNDQSRAELDSCVENKIQDSEIDMTGQVRDLLDKLD